MLSISLLPLALSFASLSRAASIISSDDHLLINTSTGLAIARRASAGHVRRECGVYDVCPPGFPELETSVSYASTSQFDGVSWPGKPDTQGPYTLCNYGEYVVEYDQQTGVLINGDGRSGVGSFPGYARLHDTCEKDDPVPVPSKEVDPLTSCDPGSYIDSETNSCVRCQGGLWSDGKGDQESCYPTPDCDFWPNYKLNLDQTKCVCPSREDGFEEVGDYQCNQICTSGQALDPYWRTCYDVPDCSASGTHLNVEDNVCECDSGYGKDSYDLCTRNEFLAPVPGCERKLPQSAYCEVCSFGYTLQSNGFCALSRGCSLGQYFDSSSSLCTTCPEKTYSFGGNGGVEICYPLASCGSGESEGPCLCEDGSTTFTNTCAVVVPTCEGGQIYDSDKNVCLTEEPEPLPEQEPQPTIPNCQVMGPASSYCEVCLVGYVLSPDSRGCSVESEPQPEPIIEEPEAEPQPTPTVVESEPSPAGPTEPVSTEPPATPTPTVTSPEVVLPSEPSPTISAIPIPAESSSTTSARPNPSSPAPVVTPSPVVCALPKVLRDGQCVEIPKACRNGFSLDAVKKKCVCGSGKEEKLGFCIDIIQCEKNLTLDTLFRTCRCLWPYTLDKHGKCK